MLWSVWMFFGALFGGLGVGFGAFGAHALKSMMLSEHLDVYETAVRYQMYHALALLGLAAIAFRSDLSLLNYAGGCFVVGSLLFSGSLYLIVLAGQRQLGVVTPIGGLFLLLGWLLVAISAGSIWLRSL